MTLHLNLPAIAPIDIVPSGLVNARDNQLAGSGESNDSTQKELCKKQRRFQNNQNAGSEVAASGRPRRAQ